MSAMLNRLLPKTAVAMLMGVACASGAVFAQDMIITHAKGETTVHAIPAKIAVYDLATLDNLNALGIDAVAGVPKGADGKGNFPPHLSQYGDAKYRNVGTLFEPDIAAVTALKPDLILIGGRSAKKYTELSAIAPTIDMSSANADLAALTIDNVRRLGRIFSASERAEKRIAEFKAQLTSLHAQSADAGTALLLFAAGQGISVQAPGDRFGHVYDFVGIRSVVARAAKAASGPRPVAGTPEAEAARRKQEDLLATALAADPTWLLVIDRNAATGGTPSTVKEKMAVDPRISATSAWKAGRVVYLDPKTWYIVGAGIDALSKSVSDTLDTLRAAGR